MVGSTAWCVLETEAMACLRRACSASRSFGFAVLLLLCGLFALAPQCRGQQPQTITFQGVPPTQGYAGTSVVLSATASSGLPVIFSVTSGPAQVSGANGSTLTYNGVGTVVVQADQSGGNGYSAAPTVMAPAVNVLLLTEPVTTRSAAVSTVVTFAAAGTLAKMSALTQGAADLDFSLATAQGGAGTNGCALGKAYTAGQTCTLSFNLQPTRPGIRYGGLTLTDAAGNLLANSYVYGYGVGPQVLYQPIVQTLVGNSLGEPNGVAINGNGDLFVSNSVGSGLTEITAGGAVIPIGNFALAKDVAVDGSGNVFLITIDTLYEITAVNGSIPASPVIRTLAQGFSVYSGGLAIDGSGNAYVASGPSTSTVANPLGTVKVVSAVGGVIPSNSATQTVGPLFASPSGVAVDSSGNVYVSDGYAPGIFEMLAVNGRVPVSPTVQKLGSGYVSPSNIRLDDTNDIFISDSRYPGILEFSAVNGVVPVSATAKVIGSRFVNPQGLLVDASGNVFVADTGYSQVVKLNYSSVPTLTFAPTLLGQTSADSPQAVTYTNVGNADLVFVPPSNGNNPAITPGFTLNTTSTCPQLQPGSATVTLAVGQSCTDQVSFTASTVGLTTGTLTTVDNNLSIPNATQVVQLNGTGLLKQPTIVFSVTDHFVDDPPFTVNATSDSPGAITYSVVSGPATISGTTLTLNGTTGSVSVTVSQAASGIYAAATQTATFSVNKHAQTITFVQPVSPYKLGSGPLALTASASSGLPVTFSILAGAAKINGNVVTFSGPGTVTIAADQAGNAVYAAAPEVTRVLVVSAVAVTLSATPNPVFLQNTVTLVATLAPIGGSPTGTVTFLDGGTPFSTVALNGTTATLSLSTLSAGTHPIAALYSGDANFASVQSSVQNVVVQDLVLTISNPHVTIVHGGTATYSMLLTSPGNQTMPAPVLFSVSGTPDQSKVTFTPQTVPAGSGSTVMTMTVATPNYPVGPFAMITVVRRSMLAVLLGVFVVPLRRRALRLNQRSGLLTLVCLVAGLMFAACGMGCGSGWRTQEYELKVTATAGQLQRSVSATLISECRDGKTACPVE